MLKKVWKVIVEKWFTIFLFLVIGALALMLVIVANNRGSNSDVESAPEARTIVQQPGSGQPTASAPAGTTLFCLQLDGREDGHLPDLMGSAARDAYDNKISGKNWSLPSTATGDEPYGILPDGTVFAKVSFLKEYFMISFCSIKCDATAWRPVEMTPQKINGEDALVYKLN